LIERREAGNKAVIAINPAGVPSVPERLTKLESLEPIIFRRLELEMLIPHCILIY
jgi:hypothetical protein